jgi:hypothetical protein
VIPAGLAQANPPETPGPQTSSQRTYRSGSHCSPAGRFPSTKPRRPSPRPPSPSGAKPHQSSGSWSALS